MELLSFVEDVLQCCVCLEVPINREVDQCSTGHSVCRNCKSLLDSCPICRTGFSCARNFLAEDLSSQFEKLKVFLLKDCVCDKEKKEVSTQTEKILCSTGTQTVQEAKENVRVRAPLVARSTYPCRIGYCTVHLQYQQIVEHIRSCHNDVFYEFVSTNGVFSEKWVIDNVRSRRQDFALHIKNMGFFFFHYSPVTHGKLLFAVEMVNDDNADGRFFYTIEIGNKSFPKTYKAKVLSCQMPPHLSVQRSLNITDPEICKIASRKSLNCTLRIMSAKPA